jgi:Zn-dependent M28 family amino/carboxypeptidase
MAVEDYNRLARMVQQGEKLTMAVDMKAEYYTDDLKAYNTIAEIPGTDPELKDQIVMVGGHMDSWQAGTGATDNGAGTVAAMEAVRIIKALDLKPRRTIRIALWTGEEQGLLGSRAYVTKHFGSNPNGGGFGGGGGGRGRGRGGAGGAGGATQPATSRPARIIKGEEYEKLSVYFNLDNGTGRIRGVYLQNNEAGYPYFRRWLSSFADLGATTITTNNTGSTDHVSFDSIGLPAFQFIQDPIEYFSRTHHSSADVFDRILADDMKQASTIMAACIYQAAMMDERFPRKPVGGTNR